MSILLDAGDRRVLGQGHGGGLGQLDRDVFAVDLELDLAAHLGNGSAGQLGRLATRLESHDHAGGFSRVGRTHHGKGQAQAGAQAGHREARLGHRQLLQ